MNSHLITLIIQSFHNMDGTISLPNKPEALTDQNLNAYIGKFLEISDFKTIENGKVLLQLIRNNSDNQKVKSAVRKVIGLFSCQVPAARVCSLQFLKEAVQTGSFYVAQNLQKIMVNQFAEIIQYRSNIASLQRGTTFFIKGIDKNTDDQQFTNLMKLSSTFFRMVHQCLYVWGAIYFPGSLFDKLRIKVQKKTNFPEFPKEFKFFSETKINNFKANCQGLIKRMQQRILLNAQANSLLSKKSKSVNDDNNSVSSPRMIKKTKDAKQPPPKIHKELSLKLIKDKQQKIFSQQRQLQKQIQAVPPKSQRPTKNNKKKGKRSVKKQFVQTKQQNESNLLENNSSRLRKKNSFNEMPVGMIQKLSQSSRQLEINKDQPERYMKLTSRQEKANKITQKEQSEGGRYSLEQTNSKHSEQISQVQYGYNKRQSLSPRSQHSLIRQQPQIKKQISQKPPSPTNKIFQIIKKNQKNQTFKVNLEKSSKNKQTISQPKEQNRQIPKPQNQNHRLNEEQISRKDEQVKKHRSKKSELSNRKKFVSSQQQGTRQIRQQARTSNKNAVVNKNIAIQTHSNHQDTQKQPASHKQPAINIPKQDRPPKSKESSNNAFADPPTKQAKPVKLKSNTNLKTVFESSQYKVVQLNIPKQVIKKPSSAAKPKPTKASPPKSKQKQKDKQSKSIFELAQIDTIQTINHIPSIPYNNKSNNLTPQKAAQIVQESSLQIASDLQQPIQYASTQKQPPLDPANRITEHHQQPKYKIVAENNPNLEAQIYTKQQKNILKAPNTIRNNQKIQKAQQKSFLAQAVKALNLQPPNQIHKKHEINSNKPNKKIVREQQQQPSYFKSTRNDGISSSRFRQFKEVSLFIEPNFPLNKIQQKKQNDRQSEQLSNRQQIKSILKQQILSEIQKMASMILQKQQESLNQTLVKIKSQIAKKEIHEVGVQCSTQTKIRPKSKNNFQRKGKYIKFNQSQSEENQSNQNLPKMVSNAKDEGSKLSSIQNIQQHSVQLKKPSVQKQQLKPNTLLYALYKRKSMKLQ